MRCFFKEVKWSKEMECWWFMIMVDKLRSSDDNDSYQWIMDDSDDSSKSMAVKKLYLDQLFLSDSRCHGYRATNVLRLLCRSNLRCHCRRGLLPCRRIDWTKPLWSCEAGLGRENLERDRIGLSGHKHKPNMLCILFHIRHCQQSTSWGKKDCNPGRSGHTSGAKNTTAASPTAFVDLRALPYPLFQRSSSQTEHQDPSVITTDAKLPLPFVHQKCRPRMV